MDVDHSNGWNPDMGTKWHTSSTKWYHMIDVFIFSMILRVKGATPILTRSTSTFSKPGIGAAWNGRYPLGPGNSWPQGRYRSTAASRPCSRQRSSSSIYCEQRRRQRYQGRRLGIWCGDMAISCWLLGFRRDRSCSMVIWCYMGMMGCDLSLGFIDVFRGKRRFL